MIIRVLNEAKFLEGVHFNLGSAHGNHGIERGRKFIFQRLATDNSFEPTAQRLGIEGLQPIVFGNKICAELAHGNQWIRCSEFFLPSDSCLILSETFV